MNKSKNGKIIGYAVIIAALVFAITSTVMLIRPTASDDLSFLKFSSYGLFDRGLMDDSREELLGQAGSLPAELYVKYGLRLDAVYYYPILSALIRAAEILPSFSPYQSVIISLIFFQILSLAILMIMLNKEKNLYLPILIGLGMSLFSWRSIFPKNFPPFDFPNFFWFNGTVKNSILLIFLAFILLQFLRSKINPKYFWTIAVIQVVLMFGLNYLFTAMLLGLWLLGRPLGSWLIKKFSIIGAFILLASVSFFVKFIIYSSYIPELNPGKALEDLNKFPFFWFLAVLILILAWLKIEKAKASPDSDNLKWVNFILPFFIFISSLSIGFFLLPDYEQIHYTSTKWLTAFFEFSRRNIGISHLFFWLLAGCVLFEFFEKKLVVFGFLILLFLSSAYQSKIFSDYYEKNKEIIFAPLNVDIENPYLDENIFYQTKIGGFKNKL